MIYDDYLHQAELQRWVLEADVAWSRVDVALALKQPELLEEVRESAIIESYFPLYTTKLVQAIWDQMDATAVFSIQLYESYKHFYALNRYLEIVGYRPLNEADIVETRPAQSRQSSPGIDRRTDALHDERTLRGLLLHAPLAPGAGTGAAANRRMDRQGRGAPRPVRVRDSVRAAPGRSLRCRPHPRRSPALSPCRGRCCRPGSVAEKNDLGAILSINKKVERLCGKKMTAHAQDQIRNQLKGIDHATV